MIEINLIPENLRKKRRVTASPAAAPQGGLPKDLFNGIIVGVVVLLAVVSLGLMGFVSMQISKRNGLKKDFVTIDPQKKNIDTIKKELSELKAKTKTLEDVVGKTRPALAQKLEEVSANLPRGVWLTKVALEDRFFIIEGSAVSKTKSEINDVHALTSSLKSSERFMTGFKTLELDMIKAREEDTLQVADFTIKAELLNK